LRTGNPEPNNHFGSLDRAFLEPFFFHTVQGLAPILLLARDPISVEWQNNGESSNSEWHRCLVTQCYKRATSGLALDRVPAQRVS